METFRTPFSKTLAIAEDESLNGYFFRTAQDLLLPSASSVLPATGAGPRDLSAFHRTGAGLDALASRLNLDPTELDRRRYVSVPEFPNLVSVSGYWIDRSVFAGSSPRVAPHQFKATGIHRMSWDLAFVVADPTSGERLIEACRHCEAELSWAKSNFLICHACGVPYASDPPDIVSDDIRSATAGFADPVSPDVRKVKLALEALSPEIRHLEPGRLFKFIFSLAAGAEEEADKRRPKDALGCLIKPKTKRGRRTNELDWSRAVVWAYQVATNWPEALLGYLDEESKNATERVGSYGTKKALGYFQILLREWSAEAEIWSVVIPAIQQFLADHPEVSVKAGTPLAMAVGDISEGIMLRDVKAKYGWSHRRITKLLDFPGVLLSPKQGRGVPLRISRTKVEEIMRELKGMVSARILRAKWRLRHEVIADLCKSGFLKPVEPAYLDLGGPADALYRFEEITKTFDMLEGAVRPAKMVGDAVTTSTVVEMVAQRFSFPWSEVVGAVLRGELVPAKIDVSAHSFFDRLLFDRAAAHAWAYGAMKIDNPTVSFTEAAKFLMVDVSAVAALVRAKHFDVYCDLHGGKESRIRRCDLNAFDKAFISQNKLRRKHESRRPGLKLAPDVVGASCRHFGVEPINAPGMPVRFYRRADFPKEFQILSRRELNESGALRNGIVIGKNRRDLFSRR